MDNNTGIPDVSTDDVEHLAGAPELLVALDFDGTLAEFNTSPMEVGMVPGARESIDRLAGCPGTTVMLVSGRNLDMLQPVAGIDAVSDPGPDDVRLVGSHGAEPADTSLGASGELTEEQRVLLETLGELAESFATRDPGLSVEYKPFAVGLHIRGAQDRQTGEQTYADFAEAADELDGTTVTAGKDIVEVAVSSASKGGYLKAYAEQYPQDAVLFIGDDVTDETAQAVLNQGDAYTARPDVGVRVGDGETLAHRRVADPTAVAAFLTELSEARARR
ncbi:MAG TPA: trehalose-phosphatase [Candidatus Corynebacterium avicola]|uniref:Trehalose 6-phosphate phosphatase n=1 Tax=Candidatus Corynebacterium avicola TaxID=2838527 RepID=A0A9D1UK35_9CORY|nr:trehalose-phosphatase [Candidatus Corynebacterium avicola]